MSSPTCSPVKRRNSTGSGSAATGPWPSPERRGATNTSSLSTRPAPRKEAASVGPPSSRRLRTPSPARAASSSSSGPERSSSSEPSGSGPRPNASRRGWLGASTSARGQLRIVRPNRAHPDRDRVRGCPELVDPPPALLAGDPARARHRHAPVERHGHLVGHERPAARDPDAPGLVLAAGLPRVDHARPRRLPHAAARSPGRRPSGSGPESPLRPARRPPRSPHRCTAACARDARTARA